jgi:hypothetical protein
MGAADLLITKPGALTISEDFALGTPMLLHDPIPGPETENAVYATRHGAAVWLHPGEKLAAAVEGIFCGDGLSETGDIISQKSRDKDCLIIACFSRLDRRQLNLDTFIPQRHFARDNVGTAFNNINL